MDPIAEMFSKIKNAKNADHKKLIVPFSKLKFAILEILKKNKLINGFEIKDKIINLKNKNSFKIIEIIIAKDIDRNISRVSRPSRRIYASSVNIPKPKRPQALVIVSTSEGLLEGEEARKKGLGGEIIAEVK